MKKLNLYEKFHKHTSIQKDIVKQNNFTYKIIIPIINGYIHGRKRILDIGCGAGTISLYMATHNCSVLGIDISKRAIEVCRKSKKAININNISFEAIDFPNFIPTGKYDLITCFEVLEHLEKDDLAIKKIFNLLNKQGIVILSTPSINAPLNRLGLTKNFDQKVGHLRRYAMSELINKFKENGFEVIETRKTEGIIRNFLFINPIAGKLVRFIKFFLSDIVTHLDTLSTKLFGESDLFIIARKP